MIRIIVFILFFLSTDALTCSEIKATYNNRQCCTDSNMDTCLRVLPPCTDATVIAGQICTDTQGRAFVKGLSDAFDLSNSNQIILKKHIIPDTNAAYDLGNAEYKIRYVFRSDN